MRRFGEIRHARLYNQRVSSTTFTKPEQVVQWLGAVQAQDYPGAKWALALRLRGASHAVIERAFACGTILRTHVMRPTWHFVTPADIRWMLALTAPRVRAATASYDRKLGIDAALINRSNKAIARALAGGVHLTRQELKAALRAAGIAADSVQRLAHLVMHAELDAVICSGALRGKQFTYALFDDRVRAPKALSHDEAIAELTLRYFTSHGPAQMQDFVWWSGLKTADVRAGLEMCRRDLADEVVDGKRYWFAPLQRALVTPARSAYLLPTYDEYLIAYKEPQRVARRRALAHGGPPRSLERTRRHRWPGDRRVEVGAEERTADYHCGSAQNSQASGPTAARRCVAAVRRILRAAGRADAKMKTPS